MKNLIVALTLTMSISSHAYFEDAAETLNQGGWFNSHHKAYEFGQRQHVPSANANAIDTYNRALESQARMIEQQRTRQVRCYQDSWGRTFCQ
jgi:hypothetical protein